jgi:heme-degrading monooxygenase HmoA
MFSVLFEVRPKGDQWDAYLGYAKMLRSELEKIEGFVDNIRYKSLTREGWILSLSNWRDEKSLVRWRTQFKHHGIQEKGRFEVLQDYHLRVGQLTHDTALPPGYKLIEQRLDETETGQAAMVTLVDAKRPASLPESVPEHAAASWLGLSLRSEGLVSWDVFDAVLSPGNLILLTSWRTHNDAEADTRDMKVPEDGARVRRVRIVRDYGMFDRREAPQYYAEVKRETAARSV